MDGVAPKRGREVSARDFVVPKFGPRLALDERSGPFRRAGCPRANWHRASEPAAPKRRLIQQAEDCDLGVTQISPRPPGAEDRRKTLLSAHQSIHRRKAAG